MEKIEKIKPYLEGKVGEAFMPRVNMAEQFVANKRLRLGIISDMGALGSSIDVINHLLGENNFDIPLEAQDWIYNINYGDKPITYSNSKGEFIDMDTYRHQSKNANIAQHCYVHYYTKSQTLAKDNVEIVWFNLNGADVNDVYTLDYIVCLLPVLSGLSVENRQMIEKIVEYGKDHIFIGYTNMEQIKSSDLKRSCEYISNIMSKSFPDVRYAFVSSEENISDELKSYSIVDTEGLNDVITSAMERPIDEKMRTNLVSTIMEGVKADLIERIQLQLLDLEEMRAAQYDNFTARVQNVKFQQLGWEDLRIACAERETQCLSMINEELTNHSSRVYDRIHLELINSQNPREWWKRNLALRMKIEIDNVATQIDNKFQNQLRVDQMWLNRELLTRFKSESVDGANISVANPDIEIEVTPDAESMKDLKKYRYFTMAGSAALATTMYFVVGPVGALVSAGCGIIGDRILNKEMLKQKDALELSLRTMVDETFNKIKSLIPSKLDDVYESMISKLTSREDDWLKKNAIETFTCAEDAQIQTLKDNIEQLNKI